VSEGIVSALGRLAVTSQGTAMAGLIETSLRPTPGTAGAALMTAKGNVVGIFVGPLPGTVMPMDWARDIAAQLKETGKVHHAWLGAAVTDANDVAGGGARIVSTTPLGPASVAQLVPGDVIVAVGDDPVSTAAELLAAVMQRRAGDPVVVKVRRVGVQVKAPVTLAERLATPVTDANGAVRS
jgi:S1-C subfamily serine protease